MMPAAPAPLWAAAPFAAVLALVVLGPAMAPRLWHRPLWRLCILSAAAAPAALRDAMAQPATLAHVLAEYSSFVLLLWALYQLAAGVVIEGPFSGRPRSNVIMLALGAALANVVGTTGASMLLLPVLLRANVGRRHVTHLVVFFIFIVSNQGGLLTPLGDPPLYLGFLHGVPFGWTLRLWPAWGLSVGGLLALVYLLDRRYWRAEPVGAAAQAAERAHVPLRVTGLGHAAGFSAVLAAVCGGPAFGVPPWGTQSALLITAVVAHRYASARAHVRNRFSFEPIVEVAVLFLPLFLAMPQALAVLAANAHRLPLGSPEAYYWLTGGLSAVLDNAPCYLSMATLAQTRLGMAGPSLAPLAASGPGAAILAAIAHGAVSMGAMTYIGNGPNLMVRQSAVAAGVPMPSFAAYVGWAMAFLLPTLMATRLLSSLFGLV